MLVVRFGQQQDEMSNVTNAKKQVSTTNYTATTALSR